MQRMIRSIRDIEVIAPNLKFRHTGVTSTIKALLPAQSKHLRIASLGVGLPADWLQITWRGLFRRGWQPPPNRPFRIWHARRNNEMIIGWILRAVFRMPLRLVFTSAAQRVHKPLTQFFLRRMMNGHHVQRHPWLGILKAHQALTEFLNQPLLARRHRLRSDPGAVAHGFRQKMLGPQQVKPSSPQGQFRQG